MTNERPSQEDAKALRTLILQVSKETGGRGSQALHQLLDYVDHLETLESDQWDIINKLADACRDMSGLRVAVCDTDGVSEADINKLVQNVAEKARAALVALGEFKLKIGKK